MANEENKPKKREWSLVDFDFIEEMVKVMEMGAEKYGAFDWKKDEWTERRNEFWNAGFRHQKAFLMGEKKDRESGLPHLAHAACNMMMLWYHEMKANPSYGWIDDIVKEDE